MNLETRHLLRYGTHAEKEFFWEQGGVYPFDAVVFNGNIVAHSPGSISSSLLHIRRPFFIDPQTHAFQHGVEFLLGKSGAPKLSLARLAKRFGRLAESVLDNLRPLTPRDFEGAGAKQFV